ncbi:SGD1 [Candida jiufengensis]|uniref:SGD1 n=1 Tax=Candida jiufengensis TaxID=497108 RepID=UPI0022253031|nr:SGD1 [Candida jiufengensis]KAI5950979.1 SGD1 [Candida jiufengensis]
MVRNEKNDDKMGLNLPDRILEQIRNEKYDENDPRFTTNDNQNGKKRKSSKVLSRKEKRKLQRTSKKQKQRPNSKQIPSAKQTQSKKSRIRGGEETSNDPLEQLKKIKESKTKNNGKTEEYRVVKEDELEEDDEGFEDFEEEEDDDDEPDPLETLRKLKEKKNGNISSDIRIVEEDELEDDDDEEVFSEDELEEEEEDELDPMEALRKLKESKFKTTTSEIRVVKEDDLDDDSFTDEESGSGEESEFGGFDDDEIEPEPQTKGILKNKKSKTIKPTDPELQKYDDDIDYYAKKLGLKNGANSQLSKTDEDDIIGGLLDGINLDFETESEEEDDFDEELEYEDNPLEKLKQLKKNKKDDFVEPPSSAFSQDDDDIEYYAKKLGIKKNAKLPKGDDDDGLDGLLDGLEFEEEDEEEEDDGEDDSFDEETEEEFEEERERENPYVAPGNEQSTNDSETPQEQKYIPPALRRKMALEAGNQDSEEVLSLRKSIKGPLNKLSESNIGTIVNDLQSLFFLHPRQVLFEEITKIVLDSVIQQGRLLDTFVHLHACVIVALYRLQGVEFGAFFVQTLVEKFESYHAKDNKSKEASNLISLLSSLYLFHLLSSKLLYDLIKELIKNLNEENADLLLRLIRSSGNQMRADDPSSLKDIILMLNDKYAELPTDQKTSRIQFLIETISTLKNNKMKIVNEGTHQISIRLKKFLSTINNNKGGDPIQVSLDDIHNVDTRGKWWLVGSAWKGNEPTVVNVDSSAMNDILDAAEPNWMELAKAQRMNTDIRRAIFISIMSATDYMDARTKIDKLALKRVQERDVPKVLIHCATIEPSWNPYYAVLANNLCDSHSLRKTFQFMLWDLIKELDGSTDEEDEEESNFMGLNDSDEETKMKKILNLGRFFGFLLAEGSLPLHNLNTINFLTASPDTNLFCEILLVTFLDQVGKKSRKNSLGGGLKIDKSQLNFDDRLLVEKILKAREQETLLRGLQYFLQEKVKNTDLLTGDKQKIRVDWGVDAMFDIIDEILKSSEEY